MNWKFWKKNESIEERVERDRATINGKKWVSVYKELRDLNIDFLFIDPDGERNVNVNNLLDELITKERYIKVMQIFLPSLTKKEIENLHLLEHARTLDFFFLGTHSILRECFVLKRTFFAEQTSIDKSSNENIQK